MRCCAGHLLILYFTYGSGSLPKQPPHLTARMCVCVPEYAAVCVGKTWYLLPCMAGHKSPILSASLSVSVSLSGKAVSSLGTLPLWALGSLWGVTGQSAEEATSCEM